MWPFDFGRPKGLYLAPGGAAPDQKLIDCYAPILVECIKRNEARGNGANGVGQFLVIAGEIKGLDRMRVLNALERADKWLACYIRAFREDIVY